MDRRACPSSRRHLLRRGGSGALRALGLAAALSLPSIAVPAQERETRATGTLRGVLTRAESAAPLTHGVVHLPALGIEQFTDARGGFVLPGLPAGRHRLIARHLGYVARDTVVTIDSGHVTVVDLPLMRVAVQLATYRVIARQPCARPGVPRADDSTLAILYDQLRQNADQYRLLLRRHPFTYRMERVFGDRTGEGEFRITSTDTVMLPGQGEWQYQPGAVLSPLPRPRWLESREYVIHLPTLADFADSAFAGAHCFQYAGIDTFAGETLARIDFRAADALSTPDVDGSIYLDTATYQIRGSVLHLSRIPRQLRAVEGVEIRTLYREVAPSVPIFFQVSGSNRYTRARNRRAIVERVETQWLLDVAFHGRRPGAAP